jgi:hypothetical protein
MRFLAALALLVQLQPLVGSALCFHQAEMAKAKCAMPHEERPASSGVTSPAAELPGGCPSMGYCAPAAPAVPKPGKHFQITSPPYSAPTPTYSSLATGEPLGPPFHPPKA